MWLTIPAISEVKVTQTIHPDDVNDDSEVCYAADHTRTGVWEVTIQNQFLVMTENSLW